MRRLARNFLAGLAICGLLAAPMASLAASMSTSAAAAADEREAIPAPPMMDLLLLRPLGMLALATGAMLWVPAAGITAMTRPQELGVTTEDLVMKPLRFVFMDALGTH